MLILPTIFEDVSQSLAIGRCCKFNGFWTATANDPLRTSPGGARQREPCAPTPDWGKCVDLHTFPLHPAIRSRTKHLPRLSQRSGRHSRQGVFLHRCCECQRSGRPRRNAAWHFLREPISKHFLGCCRALLMGTDFRSLPWVLARQPWNTFQPHAFNSQARVFGFGCDGLWSGDWVERDGCGQAAQW